MRGNLLLFEFEDVRVLFEIERAAKPFGVEVTSVARKDYNYRLATLAGLEKRPTASNPYMGEPLKGPMLVMCNMNGQVDAMLPALKNAGVGAECLKVILTLNNCTLTPPVLYEELWMQFALQGK